MKKLEMYHLFGISNVVFFSPNMVIYVLRYKYDSLFDSLNPIDGKVTGASAKGGPGLPIYLKNPQKKGSWPRQIFSGEMIKSKLPNNVLGKIWKLSDVDRYNTVLFYIQTFS